MHVDARTLDDGHVIEGDLCIVGAGAAGISIALEYAGSAQRVILLEGGGFDLDPEMQSLYRGEIVGRPYYPLEAARLHYFGGTTGHWGGFCAPLDPIDFTRREWVPHSGWPITRGQLDPFYARAHPLLDLGPFDYRAQYWRSQDGRRVSLPLDRDVIDEKMWQFSAPTRFGSKYRAPLLAAPNVHLYTYANVVAVECTEGAQAVDHVVVRHRDGRQLRVKARQFVLACSTIQNVRLLLASTARAVQGVGNAHDVVGRYFMEHLEMPGGSAALLRPQSMHLYALDFGTTPARAELRLTDAQQRSKGVLNGTIAMEPQSGAAVVRSTFEAEPPESVEQFRRDTRDGLTAEMRSAEGRYDSAAVAARPLFTLFTRQEQAPNPASRITLSNERDALGVPRARLDWRLTALDKRTMRTAYVVLGRELGRAGVGRVRLTPWLLEDDEHWPPVVSGGWHHMGATRMHDDPRQGVVNADCRVHGVGNLYLAGAGVFPTGGSANPTLTLVALALRLADHLRGVMR